MNLSSPIHDRADVENPQRSGFLCQVPRICVIAVSGALAFSGTSSAQPMRLWEAPYIRQFESTASSSGGQLFRDPSESSSVVRTGSAVSEIRRRSGLTWDQVGALFAVSRRSVHFWASGKPLNAANEARLMQVLDIIREADRGDARSTRAALLQPAEGVTPFELLASERFEEARRLLGEGSKYVTTPQIELSMAARAARQPLLPEEMVGALNGQVHRDVGKGRLARTVRNKRGGSG